MAVNANYFFVAIALVLASILFFFQPMHVEENLPGDKEVPELEMNNFTLYELDTTGLKNIMIGRQGYRFKDRIEVNDIDYTDSTRSLQNNLQADFGIYDNINLITLEGNVRYYREDGIKFVTDKAVIYQKEEKIKASGPFKIDKAADYIVGTDLYYDAKKGISHARSVTGFYTLTE